MFLLFLKSTLLWFLVCLSGLTSSPRSWVPVCWSVVGSSRRLTVVSESLVLSAALPSCSTPHLSETVNNSVSYKKIWGIKKINMEIKQTVAGCESHDWEKDWAIIFSDVCYIKSKHFYTNINKSMYGQNRVANTRKVGFFWSFSKSHNNVTFIWIIFFWRQLLHKCRTNW